jgi:hypothetical protein
LFDFDSHARRIAGPTAMSQASKRCQRLQGGKSGYCRHAPKAPGGSRWGDASRSRATRLGKCPDGDGSRHPARFREGLLGVGLIGREP